MAEGSRSGSGSEQRRGGASGAFGRGPCWVELGSDPAGGPRVFRRAQPGRSGSGSASRSSGSASGNSSRRLQLCRARRFSRLVAKHEFGCADARANETVAAVGRSAVRAGIRRDVPRCPVEAARRLAGASGQWLAAGPRPRAARPVSGSSGRSSSARAGSAGAHSTRPSDAAPYSAPYANRIRATATGRDERSCRR